MEILGIPDVNQLKKEVEAIKSKIANIGNEEARTAASISKIIPMQKSAWQRIAKENKVHIKEHLALLGLTGYIYDTLSKEGLNKYADIEKIRNDLLKIIELLGKCKEHERLLAVLEIQAEKEIKKTNGRL